MKILLLDMDGVLLRPFGYHKALQETGRLLGKTLGFPDSVVSSEDIAQFEAVGITNEWDSSAIMVVLMLKQLWQAGLQVSYPTEVNTAIPPTPSVHFLDIAPFFQALKQIEEKELPPLARAQEAMASLGQSLSAAHLNTLVEILQQAHNIDRSLTKRIFQELVLGSQRYVEIYGLESMLDTESFLLKYDRSNVQDELQERFFEWLQATDQHAVIFTNRPSLFPNGSSGTPEAEIGAELVGLSHLPYVAFGGLTWLAEQLGMSNQELIKPSPVHALAAMRVALGSPLDNSLKAAANLVHSGDFNASWQELEGAEVTVFEDSVGGIQSLMAAQSLLDSHHVTIKTKSYGISDLEMKREALNGQGALVCNTFSEAFLQVIGKR